MARAQHRRTVPFALAILAALGAVPVAAQQPGTAPPAADGAVPPADPPAAAVPVPPADAPPFRSPFRPPWPDDRTPVTLNPPRELTLMPGPFQPGIPWVARLRYPVATPWPDGAPCNNWCNGTVLLTLLSGEASEMHRNVWAFRRDLERPSPRYERRPIQPPDGYTEAWEEIAHEPTTPAMPFMTADSRIFLRTDGQGVPVEFARCGTRNTTPSAALLCTVETTLDGAPGMQVTIAFAAQYWPEREDIRAGVMELVESWR